VRRHIAPFPAFQRISLRQLTPGLIRDWMRWMAEKGVKGGRLNKIMQAMSVAVRYAVAREELDRDPFKNIHEAPESRKEKGVLTPAELTRLISVPAADPRGRLAVLLGALCGLRLGEVRGHDGTVQPRFSGFGFHCGKRENGKSGFHCYGLIDIL